GVKRIKTSSQDVTNLSFLREIGKLGLPVILSTGACTKREMLDAMVAVNGYGYESPQRPLTVLHCVSAYPAPLDQMNLSVITDLRRSFYGRVGLSDHTQGLVAALTALGLGARVFEKHLTLDTTQLGPDHAASADPVQMSDYVYRLRQAYTALGDGIKRIMPCEMENRKRYEKFIAPRRNS
ncbi:MAG TPA: N-acetylneuraminate synthase family protein, partial [Candidatus Acidoferrales bacterium]|nr:N-acetylneuraminate synthase family protein [Candidatus Acidoferrales bacterium]